MSIDAPHNPPMILAGDVGGTKTLLGLFEPGPDRPDPIEVSAFPTLEYESLGAMVRAFLRGRGRVPIDAACFGVAGPVLGRIARLTNVPWVVDARDLVEAPEAPLWGLRPERLVLINDLEAMACAIPAFREHELEVLQQGIASPTGNAAIIAPGTGLGEALLVNVGGRFVPSPSEGGHADFAARTPREIALLQALIREYGRADWEHVVSGPGLVNLHRFCHAGPCAAAIDTSDAARAPALISAAALAHRCPHCVEALDMFVSACGAEAGNLALRTVATAGVYIGGGIAPKILPAMKTATFLEAFRSKPPLVELLAAIPVSVILEERAALLGGACRAAAL